MPGLSARATPGSGRHASENTPSQSGRPRPSAGPGGRPAQRDRVALEARHRDVMSAAIGGDELERDGHAEPAHDRPGTAAVVALEPAATPPDRDPRPVPRSRPSARARARARRPGRPAAGLPPAAVEVRPRARCGDDRSRDGAVAAAAGVATPMVALVRARPTSAGRISPRNRQVPGDERHAAHPGDRRHAPPSGHRARDRYSRQQRHRRGIPAAMRSQGGCSPPSPATSRAARRTVRALTTRLPSAKAPSSARSQMTLTRRGMPREARCTTRSAPGSKMAQAAPGHQQAAGHVGPGVAFGERPQVVTGGHPLRNLAQLRAAPAAWSAPADRSG